MRKLFRSLLLATLFPILGLAQPGPVATGGPGPVAGSGGSATNAISNNNGTGTNTTLKGTTTADTIVATNITGNLVGGTNLPNAALQVPALTNTQTGVTLGGTFSGNGAGLTNLSPGGLLASSLTNAGTMSSNQFLSTLQHYSSSMASTPPIMGFDTFYAGWNGSNMVGVGQTNIGCSPSEGLIMCAASNYVSDGLLALGYNVMRLSDGWEARTNGVLTWDTNRFPSGLPALAANLHNMGFKLHLYDEVGLNATTCCGKTNSGLPYTVADAGTIVSWGIDGLDVDTCSDYGPDAAKIYQHLLFRYAIATNGGHLYYSWHANPATTNDGDNYLQFPTPAADANTWERVYEDSAFNATNAWLDRISHIDFAAGASHYMRPGHTPWLNMMSGDLTTYGGNFGKVTMTFWSMFQSPLMFPQDMVSYNSAWSKYQTNIYCILMDQDPLCIPPQKMFTNGANCEAWVKPLNGGIVAVALLNRWTNTETISVNYSDLGLVVGQNPVLFDCWNMTNALPSSTSVSYSMGSNSVALWFLMPPVTTFKTPKSVGVYANGFPFGSATSIGKLNVQDSSGLDNPLIAFGHGNGFEYQFSRDTGNGYMRIYGTQSGANGVEWQNQSGTYATLIPGTGLTLLDHYTGNGSGLTNLNASSLASGTVPTAQLPGSVLTNWESLNAFVTSLSVSNNGTVVGLGSTNIFEVRPTNSAALPPSISVGSNGNFYVGSVMTASNATFVLNNGSRIGLSGIGGSGSQITNTGAFVFNAGTSDFAFKSGSTMLFDFGDNVANQFEIFGKLLVSSAAAFSTTVTATNGLVLQGKPTFNTNFTMLASLQLYCCNGTNQVITLLDCTNAATVPFIVYTFTATNSNGSFSLTNANGVETIGDGVHFAKTNSGVGVISVFTDGANWWRNL